MTAIRSHHRFAVAALLVPVPFFAAQAHAQETDAESSEVCVAPAGFDGRLDQLLSDRQVGFDLDLYTQRVRDDRFALFAKVTLNGRVHVLHRTATDCSSLFDAVLDLIDEQAPRRRELRQRHSSDESFWLMGGLFADEGSTPELTLTGQWAIAMLFRPLLVMLEFELSLPQEDAVAAEVRIGGFPVLGGLLACLRFAAAERVELDLCAGARAGATVARVSTASMSEVRGGFTLVANAVAALNIELFAWADLRIRVDLLIPIVRPGFMAGVREATVGGPVAGRIGAGLAVRL